MVTARFVFLVACALCVCLAFFPGVCEVVRKKRTCCLCGRANLHGDWRPGRSFVQVIEDVTGCQVDDEAILCPGCRRAISRCTSASKTRKEVKLIWSCCTEAYFGHTCYMLQMIVKQEQL